MLGRRLRLKTQNPKSFLLHRWKRSPNPGLSSVPFREGREVTGPRVRACTDVIKRPQGIGFSECVRVACPPGRTGRRLQRAGMLSPRL